MGEKMKTYQYQEVGYQLHVFPTTKFKSTRIHLSFTNDLNKDTVTPRALVPYLMKAISKEYPERKILNKALEELYAAQFSVGVSKIGNAHLVSFDLNIIDNDYTLSHENIFQDGINFLQSILFKPLFKQTIFEEEKRLLEEYYMSTYANKLRYTIKNLYLTMFQNEQYQIQALGDEESLATTTLQSCQDAYQDMIQKDLITISVVGNVDPESVNETFKKSFPFQQRSFTPQFLDTQVVTVQDQKMKTIVQEVSQAKLVQGYRFPVLYLDPLYYPAIVFNTLFGASSESILFNTMREELGLVYFISSNYDYFKGVLFVYSGINQSDYETVSKTIKQIIKDIQTGNFEESYLSVAKTNIINGMIESLDSDYSLASRLQRSVLFDKPIDINESIAKINAVTMEQIAQVASLLQIDTTCLLRSDQDETN